MPLCHGHGHVDFPALVHIADDAAGTVNRLCPFSYKAKEAARHVVAPARFVGIGGVGERPRGVLAARRSGLLFQAG